MEQARMRLREAGSRERRETRATHSKLESEKLATRSVGYRPESDYKLRLVARLEHVEVVDVHKAYGATRALSGVTARFEAGSVVALEGDNGSGKSTLLTLLAGLGRPTRGRVVYASEGARPDWRATIGYVAHEPMLYPDLTGMENLRLFGRLYDVPSPDERIAALFEELGIGSWAARPARTCSRGQMQRIAIARALLHEPDVILLDEPTTGLDAAAVEGLAKAMRRSKARGALQVVASHDYGPMESLVDRYVRLRQGRVVS